MSVDGTKAIVFCVVFIGVCGLIATGKVSPEYLSCLLAWLIPGPLNMGDSVPTEKKS